MFEDDLAVALVGVLASDLDAIAPVLSMFFLTAYGTLNFSAGLEGLIGSPSWRPSFRIPGTCRCWAPWLACSPC